MGQAPDRNLALDLLRVTEAAAMAAGRWVGRRDKDGADAAAVAAMRAMMGTVTMDGIVVIGEGEKDDAPMLYNGERVGSGTGTPCDVAVDPVDGTTLTSKGMGNAVSVLAVAPRGAMYDPSVVYYMDKLVAGPDAVGVVDIRQSSEENIAALARAKGCAPADITICMLDRPRHDKLALQVIRSDARIKFITDGDVAAAVLAATPDSGVDLLLGIGGTPEGVITACAIQCLGGVLQGRLHPRSDEEQRRAEEAKLDLDRVLTVDDLVNREDAFFVMTGITDGELLRGVRYGANRAITESLVMRARSGTVAKSAAPTTWTSWDATAPWTTATRPTATPRWAPSAIRAGAPWRRHQCPDTARASRVRPDTGSTPADARRPTPSDWPPPATEWPGDHNGGTWPPCCNADRSCRTHLGSLARANGEHESPAHIAEIVRGVGNNGGVLQTLVGPRQAMVAGLAQWRSVIAGCDDAGLQDQVRDIESVSRMLHSVMLAAVAALDSRNVAASAGFGSTKRLLAGMLHLSATEAATRVTHATQLTARRTLSGDILPPALPNTAAALAAGEIGPAQVRVITETMNTIPAAVSVADRETAEAELARYARSFDPTSLHKIGRHILAHLDPDGQQPRDQNPTPAAGELRLRERRDGRLGLDGFLEPEHSAAFRTLIDQFAAPRPATTGIPDERTTDQRNADALLELCGLARAAHDCPTTAGEPPHLTVTLDWEALRTSLGVATLDYGTDISASEARRWACDAKIIPIVLGGASEPLDVGRAMRTVPLSIRRALVARDRGCAFPGCDRPPGLCQAHHCQHWADGGETTVGNCVLLCETHHRHVHHTGWEILIHPDHTEFIPPKIIDPDQRPLRNPLRC